MTYALWHDGQHLGDIALELPVRNPMSIAGVFLPTAAFADLSRVLQTRLDLGSTQPVLQFPLVQEPTSTPAAVPSLSAEQAAGVPAEQLFELRDERGRLLPCRLIALDRLPRPPQGEKNPVEDACRAAGIEYSGWYLHAVLDPSLTAREV